MSDDNDDTQEAEFSNLDKATLAQFRRFLLTVGGWERDQDSTLELMDVVDATNDAIQRVHDLEAENESLREDLDEATAVIESFQDIGAEKSTKEQKIAALVVWTQRQATDPRHDRVFVSRKELIGIMGVCRRYTYDLIDSEEGLPNEYDWILNRKDMQQYGDLELDKDAMEPGLVVDLERLHDHPGDVNKFTTESGIIGVAD